MVHNEANAKCNREKKDALAVYLRTRSPPGKEIPTVLNMQKVPRGSLPGATHKKTGLHLHGRIGEVPGGSVSYERLRLAAVGFLAHS